MDAVVSLISWYHRYYFGGIKDAKGFATKRREKTPSISENTLATFNQKISY